MNRVRCSYKRYSRANSNHSPATLLEISRKNLVGKTKSQSPQRYRRKVNYRAKAFDGIDVNELFNTGELVIRVPVGDYICTVSYDNIFKELWKVVTAQNIPQITLQSCIKAIQRSIDNEDILVDCQCPDFCLHEDTEIKLLNGEVVTVKEMFDRFNSGEKLWVYSVDTDLDFKPGEVTDVWISGYVNEMIKVTLDNGESIITTPNHRYMLRTGEYLSANKLEVGQSLMPLYFKYSNGYESVKLNSNPKAWVSVYKTVANNLLVDEIKNAKQRTGEDIIVIHHSDFNKLNNYPTNLKPMGKLEHWNYHANLSLEDKERYEKWRNAGIEYWRSNEENYNKYRRSGDPKFNTAVGYGLLENYNHKIVSIEYINYDEPIPVYDLTVNNYNNFYVNAGVILHNCYRFAYWATKYGYKYGKPETRPAKITNPNDNIGAMCKHLTCLLANKRWLVKLAVSLNKVIQDNYDELENVMDMDGIIKLKRGQSIISYNISRAGGDDYRTKKDEPDDVEDGTFIDDEESDAEIGEPEYTDDELELKGD